MGKEQPLAIGDVLDLKIEGNSHQGWGIGRYMGLTVFIPGSLPGERVEAKIQQIKKNFVVAELGKVLEASSYRAIPACSVYGACGGCQIQHAHYPHQLHLKRKKVVDALAKIGKLEKVKVHPVLGMASPWKYRNRIQLHVKVEGSRAAMGFFETGSHVLVRFEECLLVPDIFNHIRSFITEELNRSLKTADISPLKHIVFKADTYFKQITVVFVTSIRDLPLIDELAESLVKNYSVVASVVQNIQEKASGTLFGPKWRLVLGEERMEDRIGDVVFSISPGSFVQVNPEQTEVLYRQVIAYAQLTGTETVMDIYCGIGTISLQLAKKAKKVIGIEEFREAVSDARYNAEINNIDNVEFIAGKAETVLPEIKASGIKPDIIVVDPPRKGCDPVVLEAIAGMRPQRLIYVSCDPATLARDLKILGEMGYKTLEVQPVDMFPQTMHVETVVRLDRKHS